MDGQAERKADVQVGREQEADGDKEANETANVHAD